MVIFKSFGFYLAILGILLAVGFSVFSQKSAPLPVYAQSPTASPFPSFIASQGIVESIDKNIDVGAPESGLVEKLWVKIGDTVKKGQPLFQLDTRKLEAQLLTRKAEQAVSQALLEKQINKLNRFKMINDPRAISKEEMQTLEDEVLVAKGRLHAATTNITETENLIERMTVKAPKDGVILWLQVREGEFYTNEKPFLVMGDVRHLQIRVSIDEEEAGKFRSNSRAVAFPKNNTKIQIPLEFVRIEPYVIPKKSLSGSSEERVDTRVLQVIYSFHQPQDYQLYVGQQADVYIED